MKHKILVVDDEAANLRLLERLLRREYEVVCTGSGTEALELLILHDAALIISDQRMPGMTGIEFLKHAAVIRPHTVRLMLTGYTDVNVLVEAINSGVVYKYIAKPWGNNDLLQTVKRALQHYETNKARHDLELQNERLHLRLQTAQEGFINLLSETLNFKEPFNRGHARRTKDYAVAIGRAFNIAEPELEHLSIAAFLHEVINFYVPNELLSETPPLTADSREVRKQDIEKGLKILDNFPGMTEVATILRYYHEQWDGNGYPYNLQGEQIPLSTRIIAVADCYDEMTTRDSSKPRLSHYEALEYLKLDMAKRFDPDVVRIFRGLNSTGQAIISGVDEAGGKDRRFGYESENKSENSRFLLLEYERNSDRI